MSLRLLLATFMLFLVLSCQEQEAITPEMPPFATHLWGETETLTQERLFTNGLYLPVGTKITTLALPTSEIRYELPSEYQTLWYDESTGGLHIERSSFGGYSCKCSSTTGSCTVFYNSDVGYGCLQSNCGGTCTGGPKKGGGSDQRGASDQLLVGILAVDGQLLPGDPMFVGQISPGYEDLFLDLPQVQQEIKENYDFAYGKSKLPDFAATDFGVIPAGYALLKVSIYGVAFGMILPGDEAALTELFPASAWTLAGATKSSLADDFTCTSGSTGCTCKGERKCRFGYCVYTCTGCGTCNLEVIK